MDAYKLSLLAGVLVVLLVFFGRGVDFHIKTKSEKWEDAIEEASQRDPRGGLLSGGSGPLTVGSPRPAATYNFDGRSIDYYSANAPTPQMPLEEGEAGTVPQLDRFRSMNGSNGEVPFPQETPRWLGTPAEGTPAPSQQPNPATMLRGGIQIYYDGPSVMVKDVDGKLIPLPDGVYFTQDSNDIIRIQNGKRIIN